jgi:membrane protease subunit (stomatin/prohibitin family)
MNEDTKQEFDKLHKELESLKENDNKMYESLKDQLNPKEEKEKVTQKEKEEKPEHTHPHSSDKFFGCCGNENPNYDDNQVECDDCLTNIGSENELKDGKINFCRGCGSKIDEN